MHLNDSMKKALLVCFPVFIQMTTNETGIREVKKLYSSVKWFKSYSLVKYFKHRCPAAVHRDRVLLPKK